MKRSTTMLLVSGVPAFVMGWLMVKAGLHIDNWIYWAMIFALVVYGEVRQARGYNLCQEKVSDG